MRISKRSLLVTGLEPDFYVRILPRLWWEPFDVVVAGSLGLAMSAIGQRSFSLIVSAYPLPGISLQEFVDHVRAYGGPCRSAGVVAVVAPDLVETARRHVGRGVSRVVSTDAADEELARSIGELLHVAQRHPARLPIALRVRCRSRRRAVVAQTVNLSASGMLVEVSGDLPVGAPVQVQLRLPGSRGLVEGKGSVVRTANSRWERVHGVGIRMESFVAQSRCLLDGFLASVAGSPRASRWPSPGTPALKPAQSS